MKYSNLITRSFLLAMVAFATAACTEDTVEYGFTEIPNVGNGEGQLLFVTDADGNASNTSLDMRDTQDVLLHVNATSPATAAQTVNFVYDPAVLAAYNRANNATIEAIPESFITMDNGGAVTLAAGESKSSPVKLTITSDGSLDPEKAYAVPLSVQGANVASSSKSRIIFIRDLSALPDCNKMVDDGNGNMVPGVKIFSCMEVNDTNPLNNLRYTLKNSGKYMIDAVILFSGNINYDAEKSKVYFNANENVQALLDNRQKYLQPLKDRGMKIIMGILCNHDRACIANLAPETARAFAQELKALCDAYELDGIFWDDEYCSPIYPAPPGFVEPSSEAWCRLAYEVWKLQPHRWNVAYAYSTTRYGTTEIDGVQGGTYIAYALHDYGGSSDLSNSYPGMPKSNMGLYSQEFAQSRFASESNLRNMRNNGYGSHMVFAMDPNRSNVARQDNAMGNCARAFYDDEVVCDGVWDKDWKK